tara:strand:- start:310 stop:573 length:264 start_codon:yes stop_codon:yes gene_type:complete
MAKTEKTRQQIIAENEKLSDKILRDLKQSAVDNMNGESRANDKLNIRVSELDKSRIKQLLLLKEEAERKGDADKIKEIDSELFQMRS